MLPSQDLGAEKDTPASTTTIPTFPTCPLPTHVGQVCPTNVADLKRLEVLRTSTCVPFKCQSERQSLVLSTTSLLGRSHRCYVEPSLPGGGHRY